VETFGRCLPRESGKICTLFCTGAEGAENEVGLTSHGLDYPLIDDLEHLDRELRADLERIAELVRDKGKVALDMTRGVITVLCRGRYGSTGTGSSMHLAGALLSEAAGIELNHIPYSSPAAATTDLIAGRLDSMFLGAPGTVPLLRGGQIRALAVLAERRARVMPEVPTAVEQGLPGVVMGTWFMLLAPKGTPPRIIQALNAAANEALAGPGREALAQLGLELEDGVAGGSPAEAERFLAAEIARNAEIVRRANIRIE